MLRESLAFKYLNFYTYGTNEQLSEKQEPNPKRAGGGTRSV